MSDNEFPSPAELTGLVHRGKDIRQFVDDAAREYVAALDGGDAEWRTLDKEERRRRHKERAGKVREEGMPFSQWAIYLDRTGPRPSEWALWKLAHYVREYRQEERLDAEIQELEFERLQDEMGANPDDFEREGES